jgi:regulatory protein
MKVLTDLRQASRRANRFEVLLNGQVVAVLSAREISDLRLSVDANVGEALEAKILDAGARLAAYDRALGVLSRGARSLFDLRRRLRQKGHTGDATGWALARLEEEGLVSDESFALQYARSRFARGASRSAVLTGLLKVAVRRDTAEGAIRTVMADGQWTDGDAARRAAQKKARTLSKLEPGVARRRMVAFLKRRGFGAAEIREELLRLRSEQD